MAEIYKKRIIGLLQHDDYRPVKVNQLAKALGVGSEHYADFQDAFNELRAARHVVIGAGNLVSLPSLSGPIVRTFRANPKGFGFIVPREPNAQGDLFVIQSANVFRLGICSTGTTKTYSRRFNLTFGSAT